MATDFSKLVSLDPDEVVTHSLVRDVTLPSGKVLALEAGGETVLIVKADLALADEAITHEVARRVGLTGQAVRKIRASA